MNQQINTVLTILGIILSIGIAYYFSNPVHIEIRDQIDANNSKLLIYAKNTDLFRDTGTISVYRLEVNPDKPHIQNDNLSIKPGQEKQIAGLNIIIKEENITGALSKNLSHGIYCGSNNTYDLYFASENTSISYKVICDNCQPQGMIRRIPPFSVYNLYVTMDPITKTCKNSIPIYYWETKTLKDLK